MPGKFATLCCFVLMVLFTANSYADFQRELYSARVPVADQGSAALTRGAREALTQVLIKASGSAALLDHAAVRNALSQARAQVQQYAYIRDADLDSGLAVRYEFAPSYVTALVIEAGATLWTASRPQVLVWAVMETPDGRGFINWDTDPKAAEQLSRAFAWRGVPLQFPLFDLADTAALSVEAAWRLDSSALQEASARYGLEHILAMRVAVLNETSLAGDFSYFSPAGRLDRTASTQDFPTFAARGVALVADDLAARYAVPVADLNSAVEMVVSGIDAYMDYASLVSWIEKLELVESAVVETIEGDVMTLSLNTRVDATQLVALLKLNSRLQAIPGAPYDGRLYYQWQR